MVCKHVHYWGQVQGVGFRYTARNLARDFAVAGYVRNLSNGQVELVAEGDEFEVSAFLGAINGQMAGYIDGSKVAEESPQGYQGFNVWY